MLPAKLLQTFYPLPPGSFELLSKPSLCIELSPHTISLPPGLTSYLRSLSWNRIRQHSLKRLSVCSVTAREVTMERTFSFLPTQWSWHINTRALPAQRVRGQDQESKLSPCNIQHWDQLLGQWCPWGRIDWHLTNPHKMGKKWPLFYMIKIINCPLGGIPKPQVRVIWKCHLPILAVFCMWVGTG